MGLGEFIPNPLINEEIKLEVKPEVKAIADEGANIAKDHVPVETGELQDSIESVETDDGAQIIVGTDHWIFPEFGTSIMAATPFMRPVIDELGLHR